ncbi:MAG TPA: hypothetical protein DEG43_16860 [Acidimicrobiaceae bacterium]|nr:hypothetical protein [Acidimicrobiaceae bacterium]
MEPRTAILDPPPPLQKGDDAAYSMQSRVAGDGESTNSSATSEAGLLPYLQATLLFCVPKSQHWWTPSYVS